MKDHVLESYINSIFGNINQLLLSSHKALSKRIIFPTFPTLKFLAKRNIKDLLSAHLSI
jgi:hypothetical protein